jgi:predicted negative regulator of RcsB-dependent stress response
MGSDEDRLKAIAPLVFLVFVLVGIFGNLGWNWVQHRDRIRLSQEVVELKALLEQTNVRLAQTEESLNTWSKATSGSLATVKNELSTVRVAMAQVVKIKIDKGGSLSTPVDDPNEDVDRIR